LAQRKHLQRLRDLGRERAAPRACVPMRKLLFAFAALALLSPATALADGAPPETGESAAAPKEPPPPRPSSAHVSARAAAGVGYGQLYGLTLFGPQGSFSLGAESDRVGGYGTLRYERAETPHGLRVHLVQLGGSAEWIASRLRLGGGVHLLYFSLERISESSS